MTLCCSLAGYYQRFSCTASSFRVKGSNAAMVTGCGQVREREKGHRVHKLPTTDSEGDGEDMSQTRQMVTIGLHLIKLCHVLVWTTITISLLGFHFPFTTVGSVAGFFKMTSV